MSPLHHLEFYSYFIARGKMGRQEERSETFSAALQCCLSVCSDGHSKAGDAVCDKGRAKIIRFIGTNIIRLTA